MEITKKHILSGDFEAFQRLLLINYCSPHASSGATLSEKNCQLVADSLAEKGSIIWHEDNLKTLIDGLQQQFPQISDIDRAYIRFSFETVLVFQLAARLAPELNSSLAKLQTQLFLHSLKNKHFWLESLAVKNIADQLCMALQGWQADYGQHSDSFLSIFNSSITELSKADGIELNNLELSIQQQLSEQQSYIQRFADRIQAAELGRIKNQAAQYEVYRFLNSALDNKVLPQIVLSYINDELISFLHQMLATHGLQAKQWQQAQQLIKQLFALYQEGYTIKEQDKQLASQLQSLLFGEHEPDAKAQDFFNNIAFDITQLSQGKTIDDCQAAKALIIPEAIAAMEKHASQDLLQQVQNCKLGQWFLYKTEQGTVRCQLLLNLADYQRMLLSNFVGQRVLVARYDEFAYLLSSQHLQALPNHGPLLRSFHSRLDRLITNYQTNYQQFEEAEKIVAERQKQAELLAQRQAAAEKARKEALAIAKQRAEAKRQAEQERLAAELAAKQQAAAAKEEQLHADLHRHARLSLDSLTLGSWAEYTDGDTTKRIKLAVKFAATGRFVFVNDDGITELEAHRDDLVEKLISQQLRLLESDKKFADRLAKIVSDLRAPQ